MIKPGDIVMVVWACCPENRRRAIGKIVEVERVEHRSDGCGLCGYDTPQMCAVFRREDGIRRAVPIAWLIKLDPPGVETEKRETVEA